ncbi:putative maleylpyruvate isomerase [Georgfuchsia toluolica]|uniref:Maleylpyruvate isomerase n=1 Tax=Georgfuchsia toluolica TaxID=424218 RepID=A0A916J2Q8_9PROT|nr:fumarylacetoacetate hydrolase family protein [Georgfuchsia toluolica]CAG4882309.1 putative maleylpyruvate isomerase [Georgfuchsia toluolica]
MKLLRFNDGHIGISDGNKVVDVTRLCASSFDEWPPVGINRLIRDYPSLRTELQNALQSDAGVPLEAVRLQTPVPWPNKLIAYPVNYYDHATEMASRGLANLQGFFLKANSSLSGPADAIELPALPGREVHHECEIALVIGKEGRQISVEDALDHLFGYACLIDVTIRGKEERVMRKSYDSFTPVGPWIVTADEIADPFNINMRLWVNGELRQQANTRDLIVNIPQMISIASSATTLYPGDLIAAGTPAGVGPIWDGDVVTIEVEGVGRMRIPVVAGKRGTNVVFAKPYEFKRAG